jgi:alkylmercury lyase
MTDIEADTRRYITVVEANLQHLDAVPQLYRLLAAGEPVTVQRLAEESGVSVDDLRTELTRHPGTDWDQHGRIVGFNLTLRPTPHTFTFDGRTVYAFCADGALELPIVLGLPGVIESPCRATGRHIRVEVTPTGVVAVDPPQAVVSKVRPTEAVADVRRDICGVGHFFTSPQAATHWLANNPQGVVAPVADEYEVVRRAMTGLGWAADQTEQAGR